MFKCRLRAEKDLKNKMRRADVFSPFGEYMIKINDKISYIEASENPLSADIGIVRDNGTTWLFDVGNGDASFACIPGEPVNVVLSHFHQDHTGNIDRVPANEIFASNMTRKHISRGTVVTEDLYFGGVHIFPLPSSHASGSLGMEIDGQYAFVGDGLYSKCKDRFYIYNAQLVNEEIKVLKNLKAEYLLVSHLEGLVRRKDEVISELEAIYGRREKNNPEILVER